MDGGAGLTTDDNKPGSGLDDLKARLGLGGLVSQPRRQQPSKGDKPKVTTPPGAPKPPPRPPGPGVGQALHEAQTMHLDDDLPAPSGPIPVYTDQADVETRMLPPTAPQARKEPSGEYAAAVSTFEEPEVGEGDPTPYESGKYDQIDPTLSTGLPSTAKIVLIAAVVVVVLGGLLIGFNFGQVMRSREIRDQVIASSQELLPRVEGIAQELTAFSNDLMTERAQFADAQEGQLATLVDRFEALHALFRDTFGNGGPTLGPGSLSDHRVLMTTGLQLTEQLIRYSIQTEILNQLVQIHLQKTEPELPLIGRILSGAEAEMRYAVIYDWGGVSRNYNAYYDAWIAANVVEDDPEEDDPEDPEIETPPEPLYQTTRAMVVTYDDLEIRTEGEGELATFEYEVFVAGERLSVDIYNLLTIERDQLVTNPNEETAVTRYENRVSQISEQLQEVLHLQTLLVQSLRAEANPDGVEEDEEEEAEQL